MGVSTDGQICYGIILDDGEELPWSKDEYDWDINKWWVVGILGFKHSFELFDKDGRWILPRPSEEIEDKYFQEQRDFEESHEKLPYTLMNYCSGDYPMYILAIERTCMTASRGTPEKFDPQELPGVSAEEDRDLLKFCEKYGISIEGDSGWFLSSYWG